MGSNFLADMQAAGAALFSHDNRLITLRFPESSGIAEGTLLPQAISGREALSECFKYELECLSADAHLELKQFFGQPIEIALLLPDGGNRLLTGLVTKAEATGSNGGFATFRLTIEPALAILAYRRNSRVFQDKTPIEMVSAILDEHLAANPAFTASFKYESRVTQSYVSRSYCLQYRESDLAFIERILAEEGISYRFTHGPDTEHSIRAEEGGPPGDDDGTPLHTLLLFDAEYAHPQASTEVLAFHRTDGAETADAIDTWEGSRQVRSGRSSLNTYDYKAVSQYPASSEQFTRQGDAGADLTSSLESYDPQTLYYGSDPGDMERYATLRQVAKDLASKTFRGAGTARALEVGNWFELRDHPVHDQDNQEDRQFLVTGLDFEARNNLLPDDPPALGSLLAANDATGQNQPPYRNTFTAVRKHIPVVPEYEATRHQKPTAPGPTTAIVVGPADEEIFCDEHGRIKIQFHWQRAQDHPEGGANYDDNSSTWVRVAMPSAGAQWGTQYVPRIGQEVVVLFEENDIDRPLVTNVVYNGSHRPPTFSGAGKLPANKTLSGVKTKEYKGSRYNELLFDDSTGQIRAKLSSEHGKTQLNQGFLIHPRTDGKGEPRGEGFELRTDKQGAIRAAQGMLLSTWRRLNASDRQLSRDETLQLMDSCLELFKQLGEYAAQHEALAIDPEPHQKLNQAFKDWEKGSNTDKDATGGGAPVIGITAPGGIHQSSPETVASYAGRNLDQVAKQHLQQTAGQRYTLNAGKGASIFAHDGGVKAIAHHGKMLIQSQHDDTVVNADQNMTLTASQGEICLMAAKSIRLNVSGGAYIKISGGDVEIGGPGKFTVKQATHSLLGPASMSPVLPSFTEGNLTPPETVRTAQFRIGALPGELGSMYANEPYKLYRNGALYGKGLTDADGTIKAPHPDGTTHYQIELATGQKFDLPVSEKLSSDPAEAARQQLSLDGHREIPGLDDHPHAGRTLFPSE